MPRVEDAVFFCVFAALMEHLAEAKWRVIIFWAECHISNAIDRRHCNVYRVHQRRNLDDRKEGDLIKCWLDTDGEYEKWRIKKEQKSDSLTSNKKEISHLTAYFLSSFLQFEPPEAMREVEIFFWIADLIGFRSLADTE